MPSRGRPPQIKVVPCTRAPWPNARAMYDLSRDFQAREQILRAVQPFFKFKPGEATFSGFVRRLRPDNPSAEPLYVQIWNGKSLYHTVAFTKLVYCGILHVELLQDARVAQIKDDDPVSVVWNGLENWTNLDPQFQTSQIWYARGEELLVSIPWRVVKANRPRTFLDGG
jgi:hypothetical protein